MKYSLEEIVVQSMSTQVTGMERELLVISISSKVVQALDKILGQYNHVEVAA